MKVKYYECPECKRNFTEAERKRCTANKDGQKVCPRCYEEMTTTKPSNEVCATCQSWHGVRRFDARRGVIELDTAWTKVESPCAMKYNKSGLTPAASCRGYVKWCELP